MKITKKTARLIAELEYLIGKECYNPNSYDGWNDIEGCDFRYPINVPNEHGEYTKVKNKITESYLLDEKEITSSAVTYMKYKFGSNELYVGKGIINILDFLEKRYNLDFSELEKTKNKD